MQHWPPPPIVNRRQHGLTLGRSASTDSDPVYASNDTTSPSRSRDSGPPTALSGATCSTTVPNPVPLIRPSVIRTMSVTPWLSSLAGIGMLPHSGMAIPAGPQPARTSTESLETSRAGSSTRARISS